MGALQIAAAELAQSKYLNHLKASNTEPLSPPCSLPDMDLCQAHRSGRPLDPIPPNPLEPQPELGIEPSRQQLSLITLQRQTGVIVHA